MIEMRIYINDYNNNFYQFKESIFKNHFLTPTELRKLKLEKLSKISK